MSTADDYASWIVKNQGKKGTPEFDTVAKAYQEAKLSDVGEGMPSERTLSGFGSNAVTSGGRFVGSLLDVVGSPLETASNLGSLVQGAAFKALPTDLQPIVMKFSKDPAALQSAVDSANALGGQYAKDYGTIEGFKNKMYTDPFGFAADLSTILTGAGGIAGKLGKVSPTAAAVAPMFETAARYTNPMKPVEFAVKVPGYLAKEAGKVAGAAFNAKNALYLRAAEGRGQEIVNALRSAEEFVPGATPTAAEAAAGTGVAGFQQMGKSAADVLQTEYKAREAEKGAALTGAIQEVGQTPEALAQAKALRAATGEANYAAADKVLASTDAGYSALLDRPAMRAALTKARELAANKNKTFQIGENAPEQTISSPILNAQGAPMGQTVIPAQVAELPGTSIQYIKQAFDDLINDPNAAGFKGNEARAIIGVKNEFLKWAESKNPAYAEARAIFADQSKPVNQMQIGQYLEKKFTPTLGQGTAADRATVFANAVENAPGTIKKATGEDRFKTLTEVLDPEQIKILEDVQKDLARTAKSRYLASGPMKTEFDVSRATSPLAGETILPNTLNIITSTTNLVWRKLRGKIDQQLATEIATEMLFPGKAADALEQAIRQQQRFKKIGAVVTAPGRALVAAPAAVNALAPTQENQNSLFGQR